VLRFSEQKSALRDVIFSFALCGVRKVVYKSYITPTAELGPYTHKNFGEFDLMESIETIFRIVTLLIFVGAIVFRKRNKGFLWIVALLSLIFLSQQSRLLAGVLHWALPERYGVKGVKVAYIPFCIGGVQLFLAILSIFVGKRNNPIPNRAPSKLRWVWVISGVVVFALGYLVVVLTVYTPHVFGSTAPVPRGGVLFFLATTLLSVFILYYSSNLNSASSPNLLRWTVLILSFIVTFVVTMIVLILIYAVPGTPNLIYPILAAFCSIAYFPISLLILFMVRAYVRADDITVTQEEV
jgi:hypothetical protein